MRNLVQKTKGLVRSFALGFTLIEVMVALLILSVSLVSLFGAQFAAVASVEYSKHLSHAMQLARCRMSELELEFQIDGFQEGEIIESGPCCEFLEDEDSVKPYACRWEITPVELPDLSQMMASGGGGVGDTDGGVDDMGMGGDMGMDMGMDMGGMLGDLGILSTIGPMITDILKQAIRRVTIYVQWEQGSLSKEVHVVQYVVHPTQGPLQLMHQGAMMNDQADEAQSAMPNLPFMPGRSPRGRGGNEKR